MISIFVFVIAMFFNVSSFATEVKKDCHNAESILSYQHAMVLVNSKLSNKSIGTKELLEVSEIAIRECKTKGISLANQTLSMVKIAGYFPDTVNK